MNHPGARIVCTRKTGIKVTALVNNKPQEDIGAQWLTIDEMIELTPTETELRSIIIPRNHLGMKQTVQIKPGDAPYNCPLVLNRPFPEWEDQGRILTMLSIIYGFPYTIMRHTRQQKDGILKDEVIFQPGQRK